RRCRPDRPGKGAVVLAGHRRPCSFDRRLRHARRLHHRAVAELRARPHRERQGGARPDPVAGVADPAKLTLQPWMTAPETRAVVAAVAARGTEVRVVGGCGRDAALGRAVTDIDIATPDPPATVTALLHAARIKVVPTGLKHGTVTAVVKGSTFEI